MCEQCLAKSSVVLENVVEGYSLHQATVSTEQWGFGYYGLVHSNDPVFLLPEGICGDPTESLDDAEVDALRDDDPLWLQSERHFDYVAASKKYMVCDLNESWRLVQACIKSGYNPESDGFVEYWLINRIAGLLAEQGTSR